jgi:thioredoxin reductase (NADPH)
VYYGAALTEAAHYRDQPVFVVGGANSAGQAAMYFSRYAARVTMTVRGGGLQKSMSQYLIDQIDATPNIEVWSHTEVAEARGSDHLEALVLKNNQSGEALEVPASALFIFIGSAPNSGLVANLVQRDERGFVLTGPDLLVDGKRPRGWRLDRTPALLETSVPGIFAAGDVRHGSSKRVAAAAGEGAVAVQLVHQYLATV